MPHWPKRHVPVGTQTKAARRKENDVKRRKAKPWRRWYNLKIWKWLRHEQLAKEPVCRIHMMRDGLEVEATVADHIKAHNGDWDLFIDPDNLQSLCKPCHDRKTAKEDGGFGRKTRHTEAST